MRCFAKPTVRISACGRKRPSPTTGETSLIHCSALCPLPAKSGQLHTANHFEAATQKLRRHITDKLQAQIEADKKAINYGLSISEISTLTDQEKLQETMRELERTVSGGDSSAAQAAAQAALGFGRYLYASGKDYNALHGQVTGLVDGMKVGELDKDGVGMGQLADAIEALPDNFSRAVFDLVVDGKGQAETTAAVQQSNALLTDVRALLQRIEASTGKTAATSTSTALRSSLNR